MDKNVLVGVLFKLVESLVQFSWKVQVEEFFCQLDLIPLDAYIWFFLRKVYIDKPTHQKQHSDRNFNYFLELYL